VKLTIKDKDFLDKLKILIEKKELSIELKEDGVKRLVLRKNYGDKIESYFGLTRQGVRWRFHRLFNEIYCAAYESIYLVESRFETGLRLMVMEVAKERVELRERAKKMTGSPFCRRQIRSDRAKSERSRM